MQCASQPCIVARHALPDRDDAPAGPSQLARNPSIARHVPQELRRPECSPRGRMGGEATALMPMPEATMHKDRDAMAIENDIRPPLQIRGVHSNAVTHSKHRASNAQFRLGAFASDSRHDSTANRRGKNIGHASEG